MPIRMLSTTLPKAEESTKTPPPPPPPPPKTPDIPATPAVSKDAKPASAKKDGTGSDTPKSVDEAASKPSATTTPRRTARRVRKPKRGSNNWGPWGHRFKFMRRGPRTPGFKERKLDPQTTTLWWAERRLMQKGVYPVGSRRRRVAIRTSPNLPFEHMPYQCFQEALNILRDDRAEKVAKLQRIEKKLEALIARDSAEMQKNKARRIRETKQYMDELVIEVDINDPLVKRNSEDGLGDMNKPVYQKLARERWEEYRKLILDQRIEQFNIVPDALPKLDITADCELRFKSEKIPPGQTLKAAMTEGPPTLKVQLYEPGEKLVTVVVIDSDVPDQDIDSFTSRCHFIATNIPLSPTNPHIILPAIAQKSIKDSKAATASSSPGPTSSSSLSPSSPSPSVPVPWLPPFSQRGSPYHRLGIYILSQETPPPKPSPKAKSPKSFPSIPRVLDSEKLSNISCLYSPAAGGQREGFSLKSFRDKFYLKPFAFTMFRAVWDDTTKEVMERHGIPGADMQWKRLRNPRIKPLRKRKGWEAKRQGPKYRHLWKYTKRIRGWNDKKWRGDKRDKKWRV
ncbi:phosphatidylethanolamine-binding protein [Zalerion maritima]|uniref:Phosphatidylethanolamine-binding protein n=1 Tax=Zalerion maritima TaxID=339359 RepID=A0AAD5RQW1_9PEZI|nr:phosphatidylethanolamine-binding protein [Zalerion maritima]